MKKEIHINGVDCSSMFSRYGYSVQPIKVYGPASGTMLDGSETEDVIRVKSAITLAFIPQTEDSLGDFLQLLYSEKYAILRFFDPKEKGYRTIEAIYSEPVATHLMTNIYDEEVWSVETLTFKER